MNSQIMELVGDFNNILLALSHNIAKVCPTSIIGSNINMINKLLKNTHQPTKFIELFCIKVLKYKEQIDSGDESFFMNKNNYEEDVDGKESIMDIVSSLKSVWMELKRENKDIVILNMQILCELAQEYYKLIVLSK